MKYMSTLRSSCARVAVGWLIASSGMLIAASAAAQEGGAQPADEAETEAASNEVNTIVVTARFREENIQDTPISMTALSGAMLEARGASGIEDISSIAPGVTLQQNTGGFGKSALAYIRGVGQNDFLPAFEPGVGVYIDGAYQGTLLGALFELTDVEGIAWKVR